MQWHLITGEYPPQPGGVGDYTQLVAAGLAEAGDDVHVWCPAADGSAPAVAGVTVHQELGRLTPSDLRRAGRLLDQFPSLRRLLVQWVPHAYGYRALNLPFCLWLWARAHLAGDQVELMVHEPYLAFREGNWRQDAAAAVHRLMIMTMLNAAQRVWISIPAWQACLQSYALGRRITFNWLPVPSNIPVMGDLERVAAIRSRYVPEGGMLVCHFGAYFRHVMEDLRWLLPNLLRAEKRLTVMLAGRGGQPLCAELARQHPDLAARLHSTGALPAMELSLHLSASDLMIQPYPDGVSSRRGSAIAGLAHGLPIITTIGRLTEPLWRESGAVITVPAGDTAAMLSTTISLLNDGAERVALGQAASKLYQERFALHHTIMALRTTEHEEMKAMDNKREPTEFAGN